MRRIVMLVLGLMVLLFPPYYDEGYFSSDWGWMVITDAFPPFSRDIWWLAWIIEFGLLFLVNYLWKRGEAGSPAVTHYGGRVPATPRTGNISSAEELGKLNELRLSGALSEEEFAEQKARLMGGGPRTGNLAASTSAETARSAPLAGKSAKYPNARIEAAVEAGRAAGISNFSNVPLFTYLLWKFDVPVPPNSYIDADMKMLVNFTVAAGLFFGVLMTVFFDYYFGEAGLGVFLFLTLGFGGAMYVLAPVQARRLREKHNLPEWDDLPS